MLTIDAGPLRVGDVVRVARGREPVGLSARASRRIAAGHRALEKIVATDVVAYGVKTGFGELASVSIPAGEARKLQVNLLRSHAVGQGDPLPKDVVRAALLIRANTLALGYSGVRRLLVQQLIGMLNQGVHPVVPSRGSLGASGDLAPLAHIGLVVMGEGRAEHHDRVMSGRSALARAGLRPLQLDIKEGLALINGTSVTTALAALLVHDGHALVKDAQVAASTAFEALRGSPQPYDARLATLKPLPGVPEVARNLRRLLRGSEIIPSHKGPHRAQDPYTLRCIPQVLGACRSALEDAARVVGIELNAVSDNPILVGGETLSGGNFHGQALAMAMDHVALAMAILAGFSERRIARLMDTRLSELPPFLTREGGLNSGMMIVQYVAAGYASETKVLAHPASADSIPTSANQEDYNPMAMAAALKARAALANAAHVVAMEYLAAAQGLEFLAPLRPGVGPRAAWRRIRTSIPPLEDDRVLAGEVEQILEWMERGELVTAAEAAAGRLV